MNNSSTYSRQSVISDYFIIFILIGIKFFFLDFEYKYDNDKFGKLTGKAMFISKSGRFGPQSFHRLRRILI